MLKQVICSMHAGVISVHQTGHAAQVRPISSMSDIQIEKHACSQLVISPYLVMVPAAVQVPSEPLWKAQTTRGNNPSRVEGSLDGYFKIQVNRDVSTPVATTQHTV